MKVDRSVTTILDRASRFTHELVVALLNLELHPPGCQMMRDCLGNMISELSALSAAGAEDPFRISIGDHCLYYQDEMMLGSSLQGGRLIQLCRGRGISCIQFRPGTTADELLTFLILLGDEAAEDRFRPQNIDRTLSTAGISHIDVLFADAAPTQGAIGEHPRGVENDRAVLQYQELANCLLDSHIAAFHGQEIQIEKACGLVEAALSQVNAPAGLLALASHDFVDSFTVGHSVRVALLALQVATVGGASRDELVRVGTAALLHDIGKSRIPQEILFKQGLLTEEERQIMSMHPRLGGEVLLEQPQLDRTTIGAAFCHHMTPAGGYPTPALPFEPSGVSKLVRVCDVFEALTSARPYKRSLSPIEAYTAMFRDEGGFDPAWLRFFVHSLGIYPQGTFLVLDTGEVALVTDQGRQPTHPRVQLMTDAGGNALPQSSQQTLLLGEAVDGVVRHVRDDADPTQHAHSGHDRETVDQPSVDEIRGCCGQNLLAPETHTPHSQG